MLRAYNSVRYLIRTAPRINIQGIFIFIVLSLSSRQQERKLLNRLALLPNTLRKWQKKLEIPKFISKSLRNATNIALHKESRWYAGWKKFSEENTYYNKVLDWKIRYDESDNVAVRLMRGITERIGSVFSGQNEVSEVLTEIAKIDSSFDKTEWLRFCEKEVIPNVLEAFIQGDLDVLQDWCHERAFVALSSVIKEYQKIKFSTSDSRIIDISKVEMVSGKMMEQGPVLIITFQVFMTNVVKNSEGKVVQGDSNTPVRVHHVWVMCRDMEEYNPAIAWKLLEVHMQEGQLAM
uniref:Tim44 domain-containing protein n=1 Tax=Heterorhabditis bacteriophora TaxID=37862 RepID=A0A1I7X7V1_HETBA